MGNEILFIYVPNIQPSIDQSFTEHQKSQIRKSFEKKSRLLPSDQPMLEAAILNENRYVASLVAVDVVHE